MTPAGHEDEEYGDAGPLPEVELLDAIFIVEKEVAGLDVTHDDEHLGNNDIRLTPTRRLPCLFRITPELSSQSITTFWLAVLIFVATTTHS